MQSSVKFESCLIKKKHTTAVHLIILIHAELLKLLFRIVVRFMVTIYYSIKQGEYNMTINLTIPASLISPVLRYVSTKGINFKELLSAVNIDPLSQSSPYARLSLEEMDRIYRQAMLLTKDENLGLHAGECAGYGCLSIVGNITRHCRTIGESLIKVVEYSDIAGDGFRMDIKREKKGLVIIDYTIMHSDVHLVRQHVECIFSSFMKASTNSAGKIPKPVEVRFKHKAPQDTSEHQRIFQAPLLFNSSMNAIVWKESFLDIPTILPNPELLFVFEQHAKQVISEMHANQPFTKKVSLILIKNLSKESFHRKDIADELNMSEKTLHNRLRKENTTYWKIINEIRKKLAVSHLKNGELSIKEIAYLLGFSGHDAFFRSFKRWTGLSPTEYRNTQFTKG